MSKMTSSNDVCDQQSKTPVLTERVPAKKDAVSSRIKVEHGSNFSTTQFYVILQSTVLANQLQASAQILLHYFVK